MERVLENYLTGQKIGFSNDSGDHLNARVVNSTFATNVLDDETEERHITIQARIFHSQEVFSRCGSPLHFNGPLQKQYRGTEYQDELDKSPLTMLILARHLQKKTREIPVVLGVDADGNPVTLGDAEPLPLPAWVTPEIRAFLDQFEAVEQQIAAQIAATKLQQTRGQSE